jgi:arylsulfatase A
MRFRIVWALIGLVIAGQFVLTDARAEAEKRKPNIVFILCDDLGYGDVGAFGQTKIRTPNIDRLAAEGMRLTHHYSGHNVCAPSRCALMTGMHPGHGYIRDNRGGLNGQEGQEPVPANWLSLPLTLKKQGYTLGAFGKWGLGPVGSTGDPLKQGFDRFFGYNCQAVAHNFYPTHLWDNDQRVALNNSKFAAQQKLPAGADPQDLASYATFSGKDYAPDLIASQALKFIRDSKEKPFVLYFPTTVPHLALQVPEDSLDEYAGKFPEEAYVGGKGYLPHRTPRAAYAAMISRLDREIGRMVQLVGELGLDEQTIFVFTSDNGPLYDKHGGTDAEFFNSTGGLRGRKGSYYEGGFRVPCIVRWKGHIASGTVSDRVTGFEDWLPTLLELVGAAVATPAGLDGISFAPTLLGQKQEPRAFLYRESPSYGGQQSVRFGSWKAIRTNLNPGPKAANQKAGAIEIYDLALDPAETKNLAAERPEIVAQAERLFHDQHQPSTLFPIRALDQPMAATQSLNVEIIGHRGASFDAPENTVSAIKLAWEQGADGAEFDVYLTRDQKIVVCHDKDLKRTGGSHQVISESTLAELRMLDVGTWKNAKFAGEKVPTLDEMLATIPAGKKVYIEVKCGPEIVPELLRVLDSTQLKPEQTPVICFNAAVVAAVKQARPVLPASWLVAVNKETVAENVIAKAKEIHADGLDLSAAANLDLEFAQKVRQAGLRLDVWTVNDVTVAKRMLQIGVQGITTDRPGWMREQLAGGR